MERVLRIFWFFLTVVGSSLHAQIPIDSVARYLGRRITLCAETKSTFQKQTGKQTTYLNFGAPYPDATFTAVIFEKDLPKFEYNPADFLKNKRICITGTVRLYRGKPEMILSDPRQIRLEGHARNPASGKIQSADNPADSLHEH